MVMHNFESMRNNIKMSKDYTNAFRLTAIPIVLLLIVSAVQSIGLAHAQNSTLSNASIGNASKTTINSAGSSFMFQKGRSA
jgi:hypothetical protein